MDKDREQQAADAERDAYLADGDRRDAEMVLGTLLSTPAGQCGDSAALLAAAKAYGALRSSRRRSIAELEEKL